MRLKMLSKGHDLGLRGSYECVCVCLCCASNSIAHVLTSWSMTWSRSLPFSFSRGPRTEKPCIHVLYSADVVRDDVVMQVAVAGRVCGDWLWMMERGGFRALELFWSHTSIIPFRCGINRCRKTPSRAAYPLQIVFRSSVSSPQGHSQLLT